MKHYNPFEAMTFSYDYCFLCGVYLEESNKTEEHIYPRWLQREFNLWNERITLINETKIPYRSLTIPCCLKCNNEHLNNKIEKKVEAAVKGGYDTFVQLEEAVIFKWLVKLSYGMLFKELSLRQSLKEPKSRMIIEPHELKKFQLLFTFLQTIRFETEFINRNPWSILIFKLKNPDKRYLYNCQDIIVSNNFFMQMNDIGLISHLQDNGLMKEFFLTHLHTVLHPIQFRELCAEFQYKSYLINGTPFYNIVLPNDQKEKMQIISFDFYSEFDGWDNTKFCQLLELYWKPWELSFDDIYQPGNQRITYLRNEDGTIKDLFVNQ